MTAIKNRKHTNTFIIMNKLLIILILAIAGGTDIMGQSGTVRRQFYMESCRANKDVDTCTVTLYINNGIFNGAEFIMPCSKEKYLVRATMDSDTPAWYNGQKNKSNVVYSPSNH